MGQLRILSINLLVDRADVNDLRRVIAETDPDVVCTQELGAMTAGVVESLLPHGHLDPRRDLFGLGIAAKHPVDVEPLELGDRNGWVATLDPDAWPGLSEPLAILNVHLINPVDRPWRASREARSEQVTLIAQEVERRSVASVIIGDMNATPIWREYKRLSAIGTDAARATGTARRTWSHFISGPRLLRIDHAFVAGVRPVDTSTIHVRGTDHRGLLVDIEV